MTEPKTETEALSRNDLLLLAYAYHGNAYTDKQFEKMSDQKLLSMCHPWDVQRKGW